MQRRRLFGAPCSALAITDCSVNDAGFRLLAGARQKSAFPRALLRSCRPLHSSLATRPCRFGSITGAAAAAPGPMGATSLTLAAPAAPARSQQRRTRPTCAARVASSWACRAERRHLGGGAAAAASRRSVAAQVRALAPCLCLHHAAAPTPAPPCSAAALIHHRNNRLCRRLPRQQWTPRWLSSRQRSWTASGARTAAWPPPAMRGPRSTNSSRRWVHGCHGRGCWVRGGEVSMHGPLQAWGVGGAMGGTEACIWAPNPGRCSHAPTPAAAAAGGAQPNPRAQRCAGAAGGRMAPGLHIQLRADCAAGAGPPAAGHRGRGGRVGALLVRCCRCWLVGAVGSLPWQQARWALPAAVSTALADGGPAAHPLALPPGQPTCRPCCNWRVQVTQTIDPLGQTVENRVELQAPLRCARPAGAQAAGSGMDGGGHRLSTCPAASAQPVRFLAACHWMLYPLTATALPSPPPCSKTALSATASFEVRSPKLLQVRRGGAVLAAASAGCARVPVWPSLLLPSSALRHAAAASRPCVALASARMQPACDCSRRR